MSRLDVARTGAAFIAAAILVLVSSLAAANPFIPPAASTSRAPAAAPGAKPVPPGMPPGTPGQLAQGMSAATPIATGAGPLGDERQASTSTALDRLAISAVVGQKVLLRVHRGTGEAHVLAATQGSLSATQGNAVGSSMNTPSFTLIRAQHLKPFVLERESYVPVVEGFMVTLYRSSDRELRHPVWAGEPAPVRAHQLGPNPQEFTANPTGTPGVPATVMPSTAFGAPIGVQQGTGNGTGSNATAPGSSPTGVGTR